jgi:hypothetical protein
MLTNEQQKGTKFEIWVENLLKKLGKQHVRRNVEYHKSKKCWRQVDVCYEYVKQGTIYVAMVEAKFSSGAPISYYLRDGETDKADQRMEHVDNLVDEVIERRKYVNDFVKCEIAYLVTNRTFEDRIKEEAKNHEIYIIEAENLQSMFAKTGGQGNIDRDIDLVDWRKCNLNSDYEYLSKPF